MSREAGQERVSQVMGGCQGGYAAGRRAGAEPLIQSRGPLAASRGGLGSEPYPKAAFSQLEILRVLGFFWLTFLVFLFLILECIFFYEVMLVMNELFLSYLALFVFLFFFFS